MDKVKPSFVQSEEMEWLVNLAPSLTLLLDNVGGTRKNPECFGTDAPSVRVGIQLSVIFYIHHQRFL